MFFQLTRQCHGNIFVNKSFNKMSEMPLVSVADSTLIGRPKSFPRTAQET